MNIFEYATRTKLRFATPRWGISVEDLWDLPLTTSKPGGISLDNVARTIAAKLNENEKMQSFVAPNLNDTEMKELKIALEIVKHVINVRKEENEAKRAAEEKERQRRRIKELIAQKQDENLASKNVDELLELLNSM